MTPRSWVIQMIAMPDSRRRRFTRSRICAWMVTSRAVVGSSAISTLGLQASAIAIITRCRIPPENWWGKSPSRFAAAGIPTRSSSSAARRRAASLLMPRCTRNGSVS